MTLKTNQTTKTNITSIQLPNESHIQQIKMLNKKYLITYLTEVQKQKGFIRIKYSDDDIRRIIDNKEIVIALNNDSVIGYYLIGRTSQNNDLEYQKNKAANLFETHNILFDKVGYGCQVCIDEKFRNNGFFREMLNILFDVVKNKYSHMLCSISESNTASLKTHITNGWQLVDFNDIIYFLICKIPK